MNKNIFVLFASLFIACGNNDERVGVTYIDDVSSTGCHLQDLANYGFVADEGVDAFVGGNSAYYVPVFSPIYLESVKVNIHPFDVIDSFSSC